MNLAWWRNPWNFSRSLCGVSGGAAFAVWAAQQAYPQTNLSFVNAVPLALFTASFSASMGMWLYSHITQQSRDADFRFQRIYTPLYDALLRVIDDLKRCQVAILHQWREINDTSLKEFVAPEVSNAVNDIIQELERYHEVWNDAYAAAEQILVAATKALADMVRTGNPGAEIATDLKSDYPFLFDPTITSPSQSRIDNTANRLGGAGYPNSKKLASELVKTVKDALLKDERIAARQKAIEALSPKVEAVRKLVHQRLMRPLS